MAFRNKWYQTMDHNSHQMNLLNLCKAMESSILYVRFTIMLAERFMQTFKRAMKAGEKDGPSLNHHLKRFLLRYRYTPHSTTNVAPSELFLGCNLRTLFNLLKPDIKTQVLSKQAV